MLEEMAAEAGVPHPQLIGQYLRGGAPILGKIVASGLYGPKEQLATKTIAEVLQAGKWSKTLNEVVSYSMVRVPDLNVHFVPSRRNATTGQGHGNRWRKVRRNNAFVSFANTGKRAIRPLAGESGQAR